MLSALELREAAWSNTLIPKLFSSRLLEESGNPFGNLGVRAGFVSLLELELEFHPKAKCWQHEAVGSWLVHGTGLR